MSDHGFAERVGAYAKPSNRPDSPTPSIARDNTHKWVDAVASAECWAQTGDAFFPVSKMTERLLPGAYRCRSSEAGPYLEKMQINIDDLLHLPDGAAEEVLAEFNQFWTLESRFTERGFTYKRGILLWGPPGSGKTSAVWQMTQALIRDHEGIVVFVEDALLTTICLSVIRRVEPRRPIICVMEDLDALVQRQSEHTFLALLDGETQISNVVYVATTNYPEYLDKRFVDRPSRFDTIKYVDMPSAAARAVYFRTKEPGLTDDELERWVHNTKDYSIAHLREVIIAIKVLCQDEAEVFKRLNDMHDNRPQSDGMGGVRKHKAGFGFAHPSDMALQ